jgi:hypothetical protein
MLGAMPMAGAPFVGGRRRHGEGNPAYPSLVRLVPASQGTGDVREGRRRGGGHVAVSHRLPAHRARRRRRDGQGQREYGKQQCAHDIH